MKKWIACAALLLAHSVFAAQVPKPSEFDNRIRIATYNPLDVYEVTAHYGYDLHIWLSSGETIQYVTAGDELGWTIGPKKPRNHVFLKPKEDKPTTNLSITTVTKTGEERVYTFHLTAEWPAENSTKTDNMMYHIRFAYPDEEAKIGQATASKELVRDKLENAVSDKTRNYQYSFAGADALEPDEVFDDGKFTYIRFAPNRPLPSIYTVEADGSEHMTDQHTNDDYVVVRRVVQKLIFRKDKSVAGVFNDAFDPVGTRNRTGTVSPDVKRVIKGGE